MRHNTEKRKMIYERPYITANMNLRLRSKKKFADIDLAKLIRAKDKVEKA